MEGFFLQSLEVTVETVEFTFRTYGNSLNELTFDYGIDIIKAGRKEEHKNKMWALYVNLYPDMTEETFMQFDEFMKRVTGKKSTEKTHSKEEILENVARITHMRFTSIGGSDGNLDF